jgi:hypothetical protein
VHRVLESGAQGTIAFASSLHATAADDPPWPVDVPALPSWSIARLARRATAVGTPAHGWIATFVDPDVLDGFDLLEETSRARGVEAAGRIHTRLGFDRRTRTFVRVLERLVVTRDAVATGSTVVSPGGTWAAFLAAAALGDGPPASVHTHVHLAAEGGGEQENDAGLHAGAEPLISISDKVTHLTRFGHPMAAAWILSLYPDRRVKLYGYTPGGTLEARLVGAGPPQEASEARPVRAGVGVRPSSSFVRPRRTPERQSAARVRDQNGDSPRDAARRRRAAVPTQATTLREQLDRLVAGTQLAHRHGRDRRPRAVQIGPTERVLARPPDRHSVGRSSSPTAAARPCSAPAT